VLAFWSYKLTSVERIGRSQLIPGVSPTRVLRGVRQWRTVGHALRGDPRLH
jgi:hypothetical protein